jgi:Endoplasmic Reticulum Oxidoreductin 1 (ERO1)
LGIKSKAANQSHKKMVRCHELFAWILYVAMLQVYAMPDSVPPTQNSFIDQASTQSQVLALLSPKSASQCPARLCAEAEKQIYDIDSNLRIHLTPMLQTLYFKYVKLDLSRPCPFWRSEPICERNHCAVDNSNYNNIGSGATTTTTAAATKSSNSAAILNGGVLSSWKAKDGGGMLGSITFPSRQSSLFSAWRDNPLDFALLDNEASTSNSLENSYPASSCFSIFNTF